MDSLLNGMGSLKSVCDAWLEQCPAGSPQQKLVSDLYSTIAAYGGEKVSPRIIQSVFVAFMNQYILETGWSYTSVSTGNITRTYYPDDIVRQSVKGLMDG